MNKLRRMRGIERGACILPRRAKATPKWAVTYPGDKTTTKPCNRR